MRAFELKMRFAKNNFDQTCYLKLMNMFAFILIVSACVFIIINYITKFNFISSNDENSFYTMIINFIIDMPFVRNLYINKINNAILILILMNKLTKHVIYIATIKNLNVKNFAKLLWREFILHHDMIRDIFSNKNLLFKNHFWSMLCWHLNTRCQFNITFHSRTNN